MAAETDVTAAGQPSPTMAEERSPLLSTLVYWGAHAWMLGYTVVGYWTCRGKLKPGEGYH